MKKLIKTLAVAAILLGAAYIPAKAVTVSATISSTTIATPSGSLMLNKNESLTYTLTGTATGQIRIEKTETGDNWAPTGIAVTGAGVVSATGKLYSGDRTTFYRWRASTMSAGSFVVTLYDNDDVVQEFKNNKNIPIVVITDDALTVSGTVVASSSSLSASTLNSPTINSPTVAGGTLTGIFVSSMTLTGPVTVTSASTMTATGLRVQGTYTDVSTRTFVGAGINGTKTDNSTTTYTGGNTFSTQPVTISTHVNLTGGAISFPATQVPYVNGNTLDDYEEGTWTPSVGGNATYTSQLGRYVKVGRLVFLSCQLIINSIGTGSATTVSGAPFTNANTVLTAGSAGYWTDLATNVIFLAPRIAGGGTAITFSMTAASGATATDAPNVFQNSTRVDFTIVYEANQ